MGERYPPTSDDYTRSALESEQKKTRTLEVRVQSLEDRIKDLTKRLDLISEWIDIQEK